MRIQARNGLQAQLWSLRARFDRHRRRISHQIPLVFDYANHATTNRAIPPPLIPTHRNNHDYIAFLEFVRGNIAFLDVLEPQVDSLAQADVRGEFEALQRDLLGSLSHLQTLQTDAWGRFLSLNQPPQFDEAPIYNTGGLQVTKR